MKKIPNVFNAQSLPRRSFLKLAGISSLGLSLGLPFSPKKGHTAAVVSDGRIRFHSAIWKTDAGGNLYFTQNRLRTGLANSAGTVVARVDGWWRSYRLREFDSEFHDWWIAEKDWYYDKLIAFFKGEAPSMEIPNGGHHHPMLATYGMNGSSRGDSDFHLNNTPKGFTLLPKPDQISYVNEQIAAAYEDEVEGPPVSVFRKRKELYHQKELWDKTRFATLELYSGHPIDSEDDYGPYGFRETHTFSNIIDNPMATLTYMALWNTDGTQSYFGGAANETPTFEFRGFCWLMAYYDPANTEYETTIIDYINQAHCRQHGGSCHIAVNLFLITEEFNNTPGFEPYGRGRRVVPTFTYPTTVRTAAAEAGSVKRMTSGEKVALAEKMGIPL